MSVVARLNLLKITKHSTCDTGCVYNILKGNPVCDNMYLCYAVLGQFWPLTQLGNPKSKHVIYCVGYTYMQTTQFIFPIFVQISDKKSD